MFILPQLRVSGTVQSDSTNRYTYAAANSFSLCSTLDESISFTMAIIVDFQALNNIHSPPYNFCEILKVLKAC